MQRVDHDVVKCNQNRELEQQLEASAGRAVILTLIQLLDLLRYLLLGNLVGSSLVLVADCHFLGAKGRLADGVLLLLNGKRKHQNLHENRKDTNTHDIAAKAKISSDPSQAHTDRAKDLVPKAALCLGVNRSLEGGDQLIQISRIHLVDALVGNLICILCSLICRNENLLCRLHRILGSERHIICRIAVTQKVISSGCRDQHILNVKIRITVNRLQHFSDRINFCGAPAVGGIQADCLIGDGGSCRLSCTSAENQHHSKKQHGQ